jgi:hypothetical protein
MRRNQILLKINGMVAGTLCKKHNLVKVMPVRKLDITQIGNVIADSLYNNLSGATIVTHKITDAVGRYFFYWVHPNFLL